MQKIEPNIPALQHVRKQSLLLLPFVIGLFVIYIISVYFCGMSPVLEIILKVLAIAIIILLAIGCIGAGFILCKWFTDDLNDYYAAQRDLRRWELEDKIKALHDKDP